MPLLRPSSEDGWQFRQELKSWSCPCFGMRRGADQDRSGPEASGPIKSLSAVIDHQCLCGRDPEISKDALVVLGPLFQCIDQIRAIQATEAVTHPHGLQVALQIE